MKNINRKQFCKLVSLLLVIALLCQYPLNAVAIGVNETEKILESEAPVLEENVDTEVTPLISTAEVPNFISQAQIEEYGHISRLSDEEALNTLVYLNRDGTKTKYIMDYPVKYIDENGDTKFVDLSLGETTTAFETTANDIVLSVAKDYTKGITLTYKDYLISLVAVPNSNRIESGIIGTAPITVATKNDNVITYNDVFGADIDIRYSPVHNGVKEDIILHSYNGVNTFDFLLNTGGLGVYSEKDNYYLAEAANADMRMDLGKVIVYDANRRISEGSLTVTALKENQLYQVTVSVDQAFLTDPNTVYPVQIDPSITVSDTTHGANAVIDCPVYSGKPTVNMGNALYNPIGYLDSAYQIGRTAVKLVGLANDPVYQGLYAEQIKRVYFYIQDSSGTAAKAINLYALTSNSTWTESSLTWNTLGTISSTLQASANVGGAAWSSFDITSLVKGWKNGSYNIDCGFILQSSDESTAGNFFSSESSQSNWPYLVYSYVERVSSVSLSETSVSISEGGSKTLTATTYPMGRTVTWATSNSTVATVNSDGVITANKAGTATITASMTDSNGVIRTATCVVYVYIPNGVYYIKNLNSNYYLHVKSGGISNYTDVYQRMKYNTASISNELLIQQMWKIYYLGEGRYSVRPMNKLNMGLDVTSYNVDIYDIGETDLLSAVPPYGEWVIEWYSTGYVFKNNGSDSKTMQIENASTDTGATVVAQPFTTSVNCRWELSKIASPPAGAYLYDTGSNVVIQTSTEHIGINSTKTLSSAGLSAVAYSGDSISQSFSWNSNKTSVATVNSEGTITGVSAGKAEITGRIYCGGAYHDVKFNVCVGFPSLFTTLIDSEILTADTLDATDDGLFLTTTPLSTILGSKDIFYLAENAEGTSFRHVYSYYDDWYLFAVSNGSSTSYGLYKMREQESDCVDRDGDGSMDADMDDPGVTISFVKFDISALTICLNDPSDANSHALLQELNSVTGPGVAEHDAVITNYFANTASDGPYLIAEKYISKLMNACSTNTLRGPNKMVEIMDDIDYLNDLIYNNIWSDNSALVALIQQKTDLERVPNALEAINQAAGRTIYNFSNNSISVQDRSALTLYEKQAILACFTADISFNMFAAEVEYHADFAISWPLHSGQTYERAIRADMAIGEEYESGVADQYYDPNSTLVQAQTNVHGEC